MGIEVINENGVFLRSFGRRGPGPGEFEYPWRIPVPPKNFVLSLSGGF